MPAGFRVNGVDLDSLLEPWQAGDGNAAATGLRVDGVDINQRYAPASAGTGYTGTTNFRQNGVEMASRFCGLGQRASSQGIGPFVPGLGINIPLGWTGATGISYTYSLLNDGTGRKPRGPTLAATVFDWTTDGLPPEKNYEVRLTGVTVEAPGPAWQFTNNAPAWAALNATTSRNIATLRFLAGENAGQDPYSATGTMEIREVATGTIVKTSTFNITGNAGSA